MIKTKNSLFAFALMGVISQAFSAGTETANFQAAATLNASCTVSAVNINFGAINLRSQSRANGQITATCSNGLQYTISIPVPTGGLRKMTSANSNNADGLIYGLYRDNLVDGNGVPYAGLGVWGEGKEARNFTGTGTSQSNIVYGSIGGRQYNQPDNYSDNVTVVLTY